MNDFLSQLTAPGGPTVPAWVTLTLFAHAAAIGAILSVLTGFMNRYANGEKKASAQDVVLSSSNVMFLCVGMAAVMILVNDQVARAFAIGAAIALVRFRIKFAGKFLGVGLLYGVLTGMACGVNRVDIAWMVAGVFTLLLAGVTATRALTMRRSRRAPLASSGEVVNLSKVS